MRLAKINLLKYISAHVCSLYHSNFRHFLLQKQVQEQYQNYKIEKGEYYTPDPSEIRSGIGPGPQNTEALERVANELKEYIDKEQVQKRIALTEKEIRNRISNIQGT